MHTGTSATFIKTTIGDIAVYFSGTHSEKTPLILLHGVYFDHHLWDYQISGINDRIVVAIDMPLHGESREIMKSDWTLNDCAEMLVEILDSLKIQKVIAAGHSWGSMTILRAASKYPERFESIGLCNMPFHAATSKQKRMFRMYHSMLYFRSFYTRQVARSLFGRTSLNENIHLVSSLMRSMNKLSNSDIKHTDTKVIMDVDDATSLMHHLSFKALALKGKEDYVPAPPGIQTIIVDGGHVSPLERPESVLEFLKLLTSLASVEDNG